MTHLGAVQECEAILAALPYALFGVEIDTWKFSFANERAQNLFAQDILSAASAFDELWQEDAAKVRETLRLCAGGSAWQPLSLTVRSGESDGLRLSFRGRGFRRHANRPPLVVLTTDRSRDLFEEHRGLIRKLNAEMRSLRTARTELHSALSREKRLHAELVHRTKNNMSLLTSLIRMKHRSAKSDEARAALRELMGRTAAVAMVHELLDGTQSIDVVEGATLIDALLDNLQNSLCPPGIRIERDLASHPLHVDDATPLCLLVNEIVTNSLKHAFNDQNEGIVTVTMAKNGVDKLEVNVSDNGRGFDATTEEGSGSGIVRSLAAQLRGVLEVTSEHGTTWRLIFPPQDFAAAAE